MNTNYYLYYDYLIVEFDLLKYYYQCIPYV